jgi:hypothetical protein
LEGESSPEEDPEMKLVSLKFIQVYQWV